MGYNDFTRDYYDSMRNMHLEDIAQSARWAQSARPVQVSSGRKEGGSWAAVLGLFFLLVIMASAAVVFFPEFRETVRVGLEHVVRAVDGALS